jgi:hypothetical protein
MVLFNDVLDHVLRIDRVFRQVQGHLLLIGVSGSGKVKEPRPHILVHHSNLFSDDPFPLCSLDERAFYFSNQGFQQIHRG